MLDYVALFFFHYSMLTCFECFSVIRDGVAHATTPSGSSRFHFNRCILLYFSPISPVENKNDLELDFKVFFFTDSCCSNIVHDDSN